MGKKKDKKKKDKKESTLNNLPKKVPMPRNPSEEDRLLAAAKYAEEMKRIDLENEIFGARDAYNKVAKWVKSTIIDAGEESCLIHFPEWDCPRPVEIFESLREQGFYVRYDFKKGLPFPSASKQFKIQVHPFDDEGSVETEGKPEKTEEKPESDPEKPENKPENKPEKPEEEQGWFSAIIDFIKDPFGD
jgi:hypothetical protein